MLPVTLAFDPALPAGSAEAQCKVSIRKAKVLRSLTQKEREICTSQTVTIENPTQRPTPDTRERVEGI